ncbi:MAG: hypothetical protein ACSLE8_16745 [Rhodococcus sp. (in: high G+C Gram-positive bacteria)]
MKPIASLVLVLVVAGLAACAGSGNADPEVTAPLPASAPITEAGASTLPTPNTDGETTTTEASLSETTTTLGSINFLPADLGTPVDGAPGVDTPGEVVELIDMVWLFVPSESDPDDASVVVPLPEDADIIAAYGRAMIALYGQVTQNPIPVEPSEAMRATFVDGGAKYSENVFAVRSAAGEYLGFPGDGDVLRPVVIADPRSETEAFIFDCAISGSHYLKADGTLAAGEVGGTTRAPLIVRLVNQDGVWLVDDIQDDERACS